jgi:uncharacterized protein (DUF2252 family)
MPPSSTNKPLAPASAGALGPDGQHPPPGPGGLSVAERLAAGKALRDRVQRSAHGTWKPAANRPDPIEVLEESNRGRLPDLIPVRYGRMVRSPFAFLRGAAALMALDLATTPATGIRVQAGGDCHVMNFGRFASPERHLLFDITDFDETLPAPWEWDLKRLAASVAVAARHLEASAKQGRRAVQLCAQSYRERIAEYTRMHLLQVWYARIDADTLVSLARTSGDQERRRQAAEGARGRTGENAVPKFTEVVHGQRRIVDRPPFLYHPPQLHQFEEELHDLFHRYCQSLSDDRRYLLEQYHLVDVAVKVVGVGSVGTRCAIALLEADADNPLLLQIKEARTSVLEPFAGPSSYANQGQRVVCGQRLMQSASDIFLGWSRSERGGFDFYVRQLRDMKSHATLEGMVIDDLLDQAAICGWALARAHAKAGDPALIAGYLGKADTFDRALADFADLYADQTERDHAALVQAVQAGRVTSRIEEKV